MVTHRNRRTPSGNCALIPVNTEAVWGWKPGIGGDSKRPHALASSVRPMRPRAAAVIRAISYRVMFRRSSGPLLGVSTSRPKRGCLSVDKGTREARSSRVIAQSASAVAGQTPPMRRAGGGAAVVVRGRETRPHGEGRQDGSCRTVEAFANREGSR